jgi:hypothetical protein
MSAVLHIAITAFNTIAVDRVQASGPLTMIPALAADGQDLAGDRVFLGEGQPSRRPSSSLIMRFRELLSALSEERCGYVSLQLCLMSKISSTTRYLTSLTPQNPQKNHTGQHFWPNYLHESTSALLKSLGRILRRHWFRFWSDKGRGTRPK